MREALSFASGENLLRPPSSEFMSSIKQLVLTGAALASLVFINGCASVTRGTKDTLVVESEPGGAVVRLSTGQTGKTPTSFQLPRKKAFDVYVEKEGYEPLTVHISSQISGKGSLGLAGNALVGGLIGVGVDAMTGAAKDLKPNPVKVTLVPLKKIEAAPTAPAEVAPRAPTPSPVEALPPTSDPAPVAAAAPPPKSPTRL